MKILHWIALSMALLGAGTASAQADGVTVISAAELKAGVAATKDGLASIRLPLNPSVVMATRRERSGGSEQHDSVDDIFVNQEGSVEILVGGTLQGSHEVSPGEHRDGTILGGRRVRFDTGDMLRIPAGVPHQMLVEHGPIRYLAFKMPVVK